MRDSFASYDELDVLSSPGETQARRARSRWIAGVVIIGVLGLLGATVGRRFLAQLAGSSDSKTASDARVTKFLANGNSLLDEGDFEGAKEEFDKATALAEKDPAVLTALAHLETLYADVSWLKLRLLDPSATALVQATYRELGRRVGKARTAVDRAFAVSPEDPAVLRARIDVLRLSGDGDKAREWIAPLSSNASVPENAYVLAALDLAEPSPVWSSVIDRLRTAASAERDPGRARAALIYALARAGRVGEAQAEFTKIDGRSKPHPLLEELRAFLQRMNGAADAGTDSQKSATLDTTKLPKLDTSPGPAEEATHAATGAAAPAAAAPSGDFRTRLAQAANALHQGDLARAEQLYTSVLSEQPNNTEAMAGLGDVAKQRHDPSAAAKMYDSVLAQNPSYLPAILASADQKWDAGDKKGALALYRRLLEQAGPGSEYGAHAAQRIAQGEGSSSGSNTAAPSETDSAPPAPKPAPAPTTDTPATPPSDIDTTDLPGAK
ncbi:MAG TPA: tetratricopeptide repeat protein [Polyangiaceae bacterium]|nr:tetratricopeptide repeat protein [Polyangiaceae bacterium]